VIVVMQAGAADGDIDAVQTALARAGLDSAVSRGHNLTVLGALGDVDAAGDLSHIAALAGVERTFRVSAPYKLVAARDGHPRSLVRVGTHFVGPGTFTLIAGPCAIESGAQAAAAYGAAARAGAAILRGDLFKHRSSPYAFQGLGREGIEIVREQKREHARPFVIEVLDVHDVATVAEVADVLRMGARNMQNFELLRECALTGKPVMLKRGLAATIEEWLLAAEYVAASGSLDIILCERGVRTFESATRNTLDLSAVAVVQARSHLPVIVDPSHATGSRALVAPMALAAVAAGADGVMLDVHPHPERALCDGPQAIATGELDALAARLHELAAWMGRAAAPAVSARAASA
jgi:3-deoxy-7-phosphoheptulonate synthase